MCSVSPIISSFLNCRFMTSYSCYKFISKNHQYCFPFFETSVIVKILFIIWQHPKEVHNPLYLTFVMSFSFWLTVYAFKQKQNKTKTKTQLEWWWGGVREKGRWWEDAQESHFSSTLISTCYYPHGILWYS